MKDRFLFRAWDKEKQQILQGTNQYGADEPDATFKQGSWGAFTRLWEALARLMEDKRFILMQSTGLKDKNGKLVFEGDVVECRMSFNGGTLPHMGEIVYVQEYGSFATKNLAGETLLHNHIISSIEIVGNIFEYPHLLKDES